MFNRATVSACFSLALTSTAFAAYPDKPVTIIVPFPAGQSGDLIARTLGMQLSERLHQSFIVENKGGAGGTIGTGYAARADKEGYTLLLTSTGPFAIAPALYSKLPYDPLKDFAPIAEVGTTPQVLAVGPETGIKDLPAFIKQARSSDMSYASAGNGSTQHLTMELFKGRAAIKAMHVPFRGSADAETQVMGGLIPVLFDSLPTILPNLKGGKLVALAVADTERSDFLPDVPSLSELGYPGFSTVAFFGLMAPAGTPKEVTEKLNAEVLAIMKSPDMQRRLKSMALTPSKPKSTAEFTSYLHDEVGKWKKIVDGAGAKIE